MSNDPSTTPKPAEVIIARLAEVQIHEKIRQTSYAIIGALEQHGWVIVRKRHMRLPK